MSRIRTIKPQLFLHEELFDAEKKSGLPLRLCFIGLFCQADKEGRFKWSPRFLKTQILPYDEKIDFEEVLNSLRDFGFIIQYTVSQPLNNGSLTDNKKQEEKGCSYGYIITWNLHQRPHHTEPSSRLPSPDNGCLTVVSPSSSIPYSFPKVGNNNIDSDKKKFIPPKKEEVIEYFIANGYLELAGEKAWKYYEAGGWKDSKGNPVKSWKQKMQGVWFKEENKAPIKLTQDEKQKVQEAMRGEREWTPELKNLKEIYLEKYG